MALVRGKLKLVDFGDARYIHNHFHVHTLVGSSEFCAPEIVNVKPVAFSHRYMVCRGYENGY